MTCDSTIPRYSSSLRGGGGALSSAARLSSMSFPTNYYPLSSMPLSPPTPLSSHQALIYVIDEALKLLDASPSSLTTLSSSLPPSTCLERTEENNNVLQ
jgi:hypothetical protein